MMENYDKEYWKQKPCPKYDCKKDTCKCGLKKVFLASSLGDDSSDSPVAPKNGAYCNAIVVYEANGNIYLYTADGVPTLIKSGVEDVYKVIRDIEETLAKEVTDRETADLVLQQEIDDIKNSPDVVDIVATYADLMAYDTSKLGDNDIIRVLQDEQHDGQSTYYRWDKQTETWTYVGSIQTVANTIFYADLSETGSTRHIYKNSDMTGTVSVQELLDANEGGQVILRMSSAQTPENFNDAYLQNTYVGVSDYQFLFLDNRNYYEYDASTTTDTSYYYSKSTIQLEMNAGTNITITGNTISATDTTYTDFVGATALQTGVAGLVPAPTTSDPEKYLKGDGSWDVPIGTTYTAGTNVSISSGNVISATDTTYSNFVGTDGNTGGTAGLVPAPATTDAGKFLKADGTWDTVASGGGDTVYSTVTTSNASNGGAVYIGDKDSSQVVQTDPSTTDNNYKYFWALPYNPATKPGNNSINILGKSFNLRGGNVILGSEAQAESSSVAIGGGALSSDNSVAIGSNANSSEGASFNNYNNYVTIGSQSRARSYSVTVGKSAVSLADHSVAIGAGASTYKNGTVSLGAGAYPTRVGEVNVSADSTAYGFNNTNYRVIGGVHDGQDLHDVATVAQGNTLATGAPTTSTVGVLGQLYTDTTTMHTYQCTAISGSTYTWTQRW